MLSEEDIFISLLCPINKVTNNLFIGNREGGTNKLIHEKYNITKIIRISTNEEEKGCDLHIKLGDNPDNNILTHIKTIINFINSNIKEIILIHCDAGASRSASMVIAVLMNQNKWDYNEALKFLQNIRNCVDPNFGFSKQILDNIIYIHEL